MTKSRTIIFGDIHGLIAELTELVYVLNPTPFDHLVFVGDLVDKGPDSPSVVRFVRALREQGLQVSLVLGNHEEKHLRFFRARAEGRSTKDFSNQQELHALHNSLSLEDWEFLGSAEPVVFLPEYNSVVLHGGLPRAITSLENLSKSNVEKILRTRFLTGKASLKRNKEIPSGSYLSLGAEGPEDYFWAERYNGCLGHVYFGHTTFVTLKAVQFPHATGIDLGGVTGNVLAAVVLEHGEEDKTVFVESRKVYCSPF